MEISSEENILSLVSSPFLVTTFYIKANISGSLLEAKMDSNERHYIPISNSRAIIRQ